VPRVWGGEPCVSQLGQNPIHLVSVDEISRSEEAMMKRTVRVRNWGTTWVATLLAVFGVIVGLAGTVNASVLHDRAGSGVSAKAKPTPKPSPSPSPSPSSSCTGATVYYGGVGYCVGDIGAVSRTAYGTGVRVALGGLNVVSVNNRVVTVWGFAACPPGSICGAGSTTIMITFPTGMALPSLGSVLTVYGVTVPSSLTPNGYVLTGYCDPVYGC
jgi:hypothetical protein